MEKIQQNLRTQHCSKEERSGLLEIITKFSNIYYFIYLVINYHVQIM